eukprot:CAMPEP_0172920098 /NCGR_PEP_ID=MMETSP1075-20121228/203424_1 /TAXON_ID=2916 /ORGANISM="Ceratium fusus, Strain PA161109" /LENGTH=72 /DNA_ID=CAMNT_0013780061 /DNA_START=54 /DNA_END=269 /DNA_ORIENTATION=-
MVKNNPWLKQKFLRRMDKLKQQSLAERHMMHVPTMVELQDGHRRALAERFTNKEKATNSFIEPKRAVVDEQD